MELNENENTHLPLQGLRVLDLATMMAAPWAATFLADYGADVIKVEHPKTGDHARHFGLSKDGEPVFWKTLARNKRSLTLDLKQKDAQDILKKLVKNSDVVIENFRPGVLSSWGIGYDTLALENKKLIMLSVTGYGQSGPYAARAGFGTLIEAMSGFAYSNGHPDSPPTLPAIPLADGVAGVFGALSIMTAVYERDVLGSGLGQHIDLSLFESLTRLMEGHVLEYSALGLVRQPLGNQSLSSAPRGAYRSKDDKWLALSASAQPVFERLMQALDRAELVNDPRFKTNHVRIEHAEELDALIGTWMSERTRDEIIAILSEGGAAVGPIYDIAELLDDPHVKERGSFESHNDPILGELKIPSVVARFSRTPGKVRHLGPNKGASNHKLLQELGYSEQSILRFEKEGVI